MQKLALLQYIPTRMGCLRSKACELEISQADLGPAVVVSSEECPRKEGNAPVAHGSEDSSVAEEVYGSCTDGSVFPEKRNKGFNALSNSATCPASITSTRS